jgi:FkbM family methyltransferase
MPDWRWPTRLGATPEEFLLQSHDVDAAVQLCRQRRTAIQAGGHCGQWAVRLHQLGFEAVITFEPNDENYACLVENVAAHCGPDALVAVNHGLLGEAPGRGTLETRYSKTSGSHWALYGDGPLTVFTIDSFELDDVDLICLDTEGSELLCLRGAETTIEKSKPVILYEDRGLVDRYGLTPEDTAAWLTAHGYRFARKVRKDRIWVHAEAALAPSTAVERVLRDPARSKRAMTAAGKALTQR